MPYKNKKDLYAAQKRYRKRKLKLKQQIKEMPKARRLALRGQFPLIHQFFWGKGETTK